MEITSRYETVREVPMVLVKVPSDGCLHLNEIDAHTMVVQGEEVFVDRHFRHGQVVKPGDEDIGLKPVVLFRNFYVPPIDRGKKIIATVKVVIKKLADGREFTLLDIHKEETDDRPTYELKLVDAPISEDDIKVLNTYKYLHFRPMPTAAEIAAKKAAKANDTTAQPRYVPKSKKAMGKRG